MKVNKTGSEDHELQCGRMMGQNIGQWTMWVVVGHRCGSSTDMGQNIFEVKNTRGFIVNIRFGQERKVPRGFASVSMGTVGTTPCTLLL